jgi:hypothetical protein
MTLGSQRHVTYIQLPGTSKQFRNFFKHAEKFGWLQHMRQPQFHLQGKTLKARGDLGRDWHEQYFIKSSNDMQTVGTWNKEVDKEGHFKRVQTAMSKIDYGESKNMKPETFHAVLLFFMDSVEKCCKSRA